MSTIDEKREEAYQSAPEHVRILYSSPDSGNFLYAVFTKNGLEETFYYRYAMIVGDILLGLTPKQDFVKRLTEEIHVPAGKAAAIQTELEGFFSQVDGGVSIPQAEKETREKLELRPKGVGIGEEKETKPLTREEVLRALAPTRTMKSDIASLQKRQTPDGR